MAWFTSGCLAAIITKRPTAALMGNLMPALIVGGWEGWLFTTGFWITAATGLAIELIFLLGGYRRFGWWNATLATLAGVVCNIGLLYLFYQIDFWSTIENLAPGGLAAGTLAFTLGKILKK